MPKTNKKILIAEDDKPLAKALQLKFENAGIEAVVVSNGKDVFKELKKGGFSLLLLDLIMPEMDGFAVLQEMKKKKIKVPVIVSSNLGQEEDVSRSKELGVKEYIVKSATSIAEVVNKIKLMLSQ